MLYNVYPSLSLYIYIYIYIYIVFNWNMYMHTCIGMLPSGDNRAQVFIPRLWMWLMAMTYTCLGNRLICVITSMCIVIVNVCTSCNIITCTLLLYYYYYNYYTTIVIHTNEAHHEMIHHDTRAGSRLLVKVAHRLRPIRCRLWPRSPSYYIYIYIYIYVYVYMFIHTHTYNLSLSIYIYNTCI